MVNRDKKQHREFRTQRNERLRRVRSMPRCYRAAVYAVLCFVKEKSIIHFLAVRSGISLALAPTLVPEHIVFA